MTRLRVWVAAVLVGLVIAQVPSVAASPAQRDGATRTLPSRVHDNPGSLKDIGTLPKSPAARVDGAVPGQIGDAGPKAAAEPKNLPKADPVDSQVSQIHGAAPDPITQRQEVVAARSEMSRVFLNPDGTHTVEESSDRVNFKAADGSWQSIDSRVVPSKSDPSVLVNAANDYTVEFAPLSKGGVRVVGSDKAELSFVPDVAGDVAPKVGPVPNSVVYPEVWPGVDVMYVVRPSGVEEVLQVKRDPGRGSFPFVLGGADLRATADGGFEAVAGGKTSSLSIAPVYVTDRRGVDIAPAESRYASVVGAVPGDSARGDSPAVKQRFLKPRRFDVSVDAGWLRSLPADAFPVRIDPTVTTASIANVQRLRNDGVADCNASPASCQSRVGTFSTAKVRSYTKVQLSDIWYWRSLLGLDVVSASVEVQADTAGVSWPPTSTSVSVFDDMPYSSGPTYAYGALGTSPSTLIGSTSVNTSTLVGLADITTRFDIWEAYENAAPGSIPTRYIGLGGDESGVYSWMNLSSVTVKATFQNQTPGAALFYGGVQQTVYPPDPHNINTVSPSVTATVVDLDGDVMSGYFSMCTLATPPSCTLSSTFTGIANGGSVSWTPPMNWQTYYVVFFTVFDGLNASDTLPGLFRAEVPAVNPTWQVGSDPYSGFAGGVNLENGSYFGEQTDTSVAAVGPKLEAKRSYNSLDTRIGSYGVGWSSDYEMAADWNASAPGVSIRRPDGRTEFFGKNSGGTYTSPLGSAAKMVETSGPTWTLTDSDATVYVFSSTGRLSSITDEAGRALQFTYNGSGQLTLVKDAVSQRTLTYTWATPSGATKAHIASVSSDSVTGAGVSTWTYGYSADLLTDVWDSLHLSSSSVKTHYGYDGSSKLTSWLDPNGHTEAALTYDGSGRVATKANGVSATYTYTYAVPSPVTGEAVETTVKDPRKTASDPNGGLTTWGFDSFHRLVRRTNEEGKSRGWTYDTNGFLTQLTFEDLSAEQYTNDASGNVTAKTDRWSKISYFTFDSKNRVTSTSDPRSANSSDTTYRTTTTYDSLGNILTVTPPSPIGVTTNTYTTGSEAVYPSSGSLTMPAGLLKTTTTPLGGVTTYSYNAGGDLTKVVDSALGKTTTLTYDELGRVLSKTDSGTGIPSGATWTATYDKLSRAATRTEPSVTNVITSNSRQRRITTTYDGSSNVTQTEDEPVVTAAADPARVTTFTYDNADRQLSRTLTVGATSVVSSMEYDLDGNVSATVDPEGRRTEAAFDKRDLETSRALKSYQSDPAASSTPFDLTVATFTYDDMGRKVTSMDAEDRQQSFTYTIGDQLDVTTALTFDERSGSTSNITLSDSDYDNAGHVTALYEGNGTRKTTTSYNNAGFKSGEIVWQNVAVTSIGAGTKLRETTFTYDAAAHVTSELRKGLGVASDREQRTHYTSAGLRDWTEVENGPGGTDDLRTTFTQDARGLTTAVGDPDGKTVTNTYDVLGRLTSVKRPSVTNETSGGTPAASQPEDKFGYDTFGDTTETRDPNGNVTSHTFDQLGREVGVSYPSYTPAGGSAMTPTESMSYDKVGNMASKTDRRGKVSSFDFDKLNRVYRATTPGTASGTPAVSLNRYDKVGNVRSTTDAVGAVVDYTYDDLNRKRTSAAVVRQPSTHTVTTTFDYDRLGNTTWQEDPAAPTNAGTVSAVTTQEFNAAGDRLSVTDALSHTTTLSSSPFGEVASVLDATNHKMTMTYDQAGRQLTTANLGDLGIAPPALTTTFGYDRRSNRTSVTTPEGRVTKSTFDDASRVTGVTAGFGSGAAVTTSYFYDAAGNNTRIRNGRNLDTIIEYQPWNLPESRIEPASVGGQPVSDRRWRRSYNAAGGASSDEQPGSVSISRTFDEAGRVLTETGSGATGSRTFGYDVAGRTTSISHPSSTITASYDDRGLPLTIGGGGASTTNTYDDASRLSQRVDGAGTSSFVYDAAGNVDTQSDPGSGYDVHLFHDGVNRLEAATFDAPGAGAWSGGPFLWQGADDYGRTMQNMYFPDGSSGPAYERDYYFDGDGNVAYEAVGGSSTPADDGWHTYTYNGAGQLDSWTDPSSTTTTYGYDGAGNRTQAGGTTFTYDDQNHLTGDGTTTYNWSLRGTQSSSVVGGVTTSRTYDAFGLELTDGTVTYTYDGLGRIATRNSTTFKYNGTGLDPISDGTWTTVQTVDRVPLSIKSGSAVDWALTDRHNDLSALMNPTTGAIDATTSYDPFGKVLGRTGSTVPTVGFQSDFTDPTTSEVWMGARFYQPGGDTFTSRDTSDGSLSKPVSLNRYTYGDDDPLSGIDPDGHRLIEGDSVRTSFVSPPNPKLVSSPAAQRNLTVNRKKSEMKAKRETAQRIVNTVANANVGKNKTTTNAAPVKELAERYHVSLPMLFEALLADSNRREYAQPYTDDWDRMMSVGEALGTVRVTPQVKEYQTQSQMCRYGLGACYAAAYLLRGGDAKTAARIPAYLCSGTGRMDGKYCDRGGVEEDFVGNFIIGAIASLGAGFIASKLVGGATALISSAGESATSIELSEIAGSIEGVTATNSLATGTDEAVFWSGIRGGDSTAASWAAKNSGASLESTLAERGVSLPAWDASNPSVVSAWRSASADFASGARGTVRVLQEDAVRVNSVWAEVEYPALKANPNVTSIRGVDPRTGAETVLWSR